MARTARIKQESECVANYHLMSRTNNKVFLFADPHMRDLLVEALRRAAAFSGVELLAFTIMFNHFHAITRVDRTGGPGTPRQAWLNYHDERNMDHKQTEM